MSQPHRKKEWFDSSSFWRETYSFMFPDERIAAASDTVQKSLALANVRGNAVLDLCCGPGRIAVELSRHGFAVTGVDRTKFLLDKARAIARSSRLEVEWVQKDMRDFVRRESYDLAMSMFTSFGYFENRKDDATVLSNVFESLRPGGVFLMEMMGKETLLEIFMPYSAETLPDRSMLVERRQPIDGWTRIQNDWTVIRNGRIRQFRFHVNLYTGKELRESLEKAGFVRIKLYGNFLGAPYDAKAARLIAVGRKPR